MLRSVFKPARPKLPRTSGSIFWRTVRQFALLATFSVLLFSGALFIAARPLPPFLVSLVLLLGTLVFALAVALAYFLAKGLTGPIVSLSRRVARLGPDHWSYESSGRVTDEVGTLDAVVADMAHRLERGYQYLQSEVEKRTSELKEQYLKDRTILTSIHHGVVVTDANGLIIDVNPMAVQIMGFSRPEEVLGKPAIAMLSLSSHHHPVPDEEHPVALCLHSHAEVRPQPQEQVSVERPDRSRIPVMFVVSPLLSGASLLGAVAVFHDVTEERKLDYMKSEFISLASHQLRTPLSTISWYVELLETDSQEKLTETQESYVAEMRTASQRMTLLIDALLHVSKLEGGGVAPVPQEMDIAALVRDIAEDERSLAKDRKISLELDIPEKLTIISDPTFVQIILHNILSNAVKYSKAGGSIDVSLRLSDTQVSITVQDTGLGIPETEQRYLFTRLFRASNATKADTTGSGLGLYISRMLAEQLKGRISFLSTEGKGTSFTLELPLGASKTSETASSAAS
ncbi:MAG: ATP-binding protein [Candidatus Peribacteraceae bacterium]|nr:ATP-binding protein [Candidatus Peribacteraceae bacterium]MDD5741817.1 ATP-binding protein [Candidatus Peribacteraceae bacterium]